MLTDEEKNDILAKLISTKEGRAKIIQVAKDTNTMDQLGQAILDCCSNFCKPLGK